MAMPPIPSINGGTQASSNGDAAIYGGDYKGRFNYSSGLPSWSIPAAVVVTAIIVYSLRR